MKNPKKCGKSLALVGIYICRLENIPCLMVDGCAEDRVREFVEAMSEVIKKGETNDSNT